MSTGTIVQIGIVVLLLMVLVVSWFRGLRQPDERMPHIRHPQRHNVRHGGAK
jgi:hypothetical protein